MPASVPCIEYAFELKEDDRERKPNFPAMTNGDIMNGKPRT